MKLVYCSLCGDIFNLIKFRPRQCSCGQASGQYDEDGLIAYVSGSSAEVVGISNSSFEDAWNAQNRSPEGDTRRLITGAREGHKFEAFFVPRIGEEHHVVRQG